MVGGQPGGLFQVVGGSGVKDALRQAMRLLDDVSEFVGQQPVTTLGAWLVLVRPEHNIGASHAQGQARRA